MKLSVTTGALVPCVSSGCPQTTTRGTGPLGPPRVCPSASSLPSVTFKLLQAEQLRKLPGSCVRRQHRGHLHGVFGFQGPAGLAPTGTSPSITDLREAHASPAATTASMALTLSLSFIQYQSHNRRRDIETAGSQREARHTPITPFKYLLHRKAFPPSPEGTKMCSSQINISDQTSSSGSNVTFLKMQIEN